MKSKRALLFSILILVTISLILLIRNSANNNSNYTSKYQSTNSLHTKGSNNRFILIECLGAKMPQNAIFNVPTNGQDWSIKYYNGDIVTYKIISGNSNNPLCEINTIDSFGDHCEICITSDGDKKAIITFKYGSKTITYKGYAD
jgi:hypothetical protein